MSTSFQRGIFDSFNINPYSKVSKKTPINVTLRIFKKKKTFSLPSSSHEKENIPSRLYFVQSEGISSSQTLIGSAETEN